MIPEFISEKFITRLYTIEYDGKIGGQTLRLYADDYVKPVFCHTHGIGRILTMQQSISSSLKTTSHSLATTLLCMSIL